MTTPSNPLPGNPVESQGTVTPVLNPTRPLYWCIRRELWENRSIYIAPLAAAAVYLFGFQLSLFKLPHRMREDLKMDAARQAYEFARPYHFIALMILVTAFIVGFFYGLDALYSERRDRSMLFWKSLPVSDVTTVLSKASIPMVVLPLISFAIIVVSQILMLLLSSVALGAAGMSASPLWTQLRLFQMDLVLLYGLIVLALWHAPIYGWLLLISVWAKRSTFLWAVFPLVGVCILEKMVFRSAHFAHLLMYRLGGSFATAFDMSQGGSLMPLAVATPGKFLSSPGLWIGLVFAAFFLATAIRLRRYREPI
jgi:ABC-2 type transport system permease protein